MMTAAIAMGASLFRIAPVYSNVDFQRPYPFHVYIQPGLRDTFPEFVRIVNPKTNWSIVAHTVVDSRLSPMIDIGAVPEVLAIIGCTVTADVRVEDA